MLLSIWERYFLREIFKVLILFIGCFYGLYVLIDYSSHTSAAYQHTHFRGLDLIIYYLCEFVRRADVLLPFALLIACTRTLLQLMLNSELVALMASGIPLKRLLRPFLAVGLLFTILIYLNNQYFLPAAAQELDRIEASYSSLAKNKDKYRPSAQHIALDDNSTLLFQRYDAPGQRFFDAYWVRSADDVYRIKFLYPHGDVPIGNFVDHLQRDAEGKLTVSESFQTYPLNEMRFNRKKLRNTLTPPEEQSLINLWKQLPAPGNPLSEKQAQLSSAFYYKLVMPWLCLLAILIPIPFSVAFSRQMPVFSVYTIGILALVIFYLVMNASLILGGHQVFSPIAVIVLPFTFFASIVIWRYFRIR